LRVVRVEVRQQFIALDEGHKVCCVHDDEHSTSDIRSMTERTRQDILHTADQIRLEPVECNTINAINAGAIVALKTRLMLENGWHASLHCSIGDPVELYLMHSR